MWGVLHPFESGPDQIALRWIQWRKLLVGVGHTLKNGIQQLEPILEWELHHCFFKRGVHDFTVRHQLVEIKVCPQPPNLYDKARACMIMHFGLEFLNNSGGCQC